MPDLTGYVSRYGTNLRTKCPGYARVGVGGGDKGVLGFDSIGALSFYMEITVVPVGQRIEQSFPLEFL